MIAGLEQPDTGRVEIAGEDATSKPARKRGVGFVFQHYAAFKHMTVRDNIAFGLTIRKRPKDEIRKKVDELLELVHLEGFADRYPAQLSGGQRQRMALARALAVEPEVLLLDEPFGALDATVRKELRAWLRRLHDEVHVTTVFVTHDQEEAMEVAEQIVVLEQGRDRAGRRAARPLRAPGERVRHELRRAGLQARRGVGPAARRGHLAGADRRRRRGDDRPRDPPRLRGARGADAARRAPDPGADDPRPRGRAGAAQGQIVWVRPGRTTRFDGGKETVDSVPEVAA